MPVLLPIFIDANIYLDFYHFSKDDLKELDKLVAVLKAGEATLLISQQVKDEFARNREGKIADALKQFKSDRVPKSFPQLCMEYAEYAEAKKHEQALEAARSKLIERVTEHAIARTLKADELIRHLWDQAKIVPAGGEIMRLARLRKECGNPPGKKSDPLGDQVSWEALLAYEYEADLHFVSDDVDFRSALEGVPFSRFLADEWSIRQPRIKLIPYTRLSAFLSDKFPKIKLASEAEKDLLISQLERSSSFTRTHRVIAKLRNVTDFTDDQVNAIVMAFLHNEQVNRIVVDEDVFTFMRDVMRGRVDAIHKDDLAALHRHMARYEGPYRSQHDSSAT